MKARDVMVSPVITVKPSASIKEVAQSLQQHHISALPVVDAAGQLIGIVSESDLMRRADLGTERQRSRWLSALFVDEERLAAEYVRAHGRKVADVMTKRVITAAPDTSLNEIASLLEKHGIKRVPILENGALVGIVSRANLIQALAADRKGLEIPIPDSKLRDRIMSHLNAQPWAHTSLINVTVNDGIVDIWGLTLSKEEKQALRVAAESIPGVRGVNDNVIMRSLHAAY